MDKNYWLDRKLRLEQLKYQRDFLRCLSQGGSFIIDWEKVGTVTWIDGEGKLHAGRYGKLPMCAPQCYGVRPM